MHLNKHVVNNEQKVNDFRGHDKDVEAPSGLVKTDTVKLAAELESAWIKIITQHISSCWELSNTIYCT